jgi:ATP-dependent DNA ligase
LCFLFDLLILGGEDLRNQPLEVRRKLLHTRVMSRLAEPIGFSETIRGSAVKLSGTYSSGARAGP